MATIRKCINLAEEGEILHWSRKFGVTPEELRAAVKAVGPLPEDVRPYLKKKEVARFLWREGVW
jgi:hypothetical protein